VTRPNIAADLAGLVVSLDRLDPLPGNPRVGDVDAVAASYAEFGQRKPIVARRTGTGRGEVEAGNTQLAAARSLGWDEIAVVWVDDDELRGAAFALADNHTAELGSYDRVALADMVGLVAAEPELLAATAYTADDLALLMAGLEDDADGPGLDEIPDTAPAHTAPGDLWILGGHRLMCGDCRDPEVVADLLAGVTVNLAVTSPPYATRRKYDETSGFVPIPPDDYVDWFEPVAANVADHLAEDGSWLVNIKPEAEDLDTSLYVVDLVAAHVRRWGWHYATEFCWERSGVPKHATLRLKNAFEPVYQFARNRWRFRSQNVRVRTETSIINHGPGVGATSLHLLQGIGGDAVIPDERKGGPGWAFPSNRLPTFSGSYEAVGHTAAFPVGLPGFFARLFTDPGDIVFDPFVGSGSTILAAQVEGRVGYGIELSAGYVDIACRRFERVTGIVPTRASTGEPVSFIPDPDPDDDEAETG
jgi:DNA modification methylase